MDKRESQIISACEPLDGSRAGFLSPVVYELLEAWGWGVMGGEGKLETQAVQGSEGGDCWAEASSVPPVDCAVIESISGWLGPQGGERQAALPGVPCRPPPLPLPGSLGAPGLEDCPTTTLSFRERCFPQTEVGAGTRGRGKGCKAGKE